MTVITDTQAPAPVARTRNKHEDRCDRCGAEAFFIFIKDELELCFCAHHGKKNLEALKTQNWTVLDFTSEIV